MGAAIRLSRALAYAPVALRLRWEKTFRPSAGLAALFMADRPFELLTKRK